LALLCPLGTFPKKFHRDPSTFYLVIVVTNKQTDRQTNAGKNIIPRFRGDKKPLQNGNGEGNTADENFSIPRNQNVLFVISDGLQTVILCSNKILQFLTGVLGVC